MAVISGSTSQNSSPKKHRNSLNRDIFSGLGMGGPAFILLLMFLIGPFFMGVYFSFTNERLISPNPAEWVGLRNYTRLLKVSVLPLEPVMNEQTGQFEIDEAGNLVYPRSRDYTRDTETYPQYEGLREWFTINRGNTKYVFLAADPVFMIALRNTLFFAVVVIPLQSGMGLLLALLVNQQLAGRTFFRTVYFSPVVVSMVVISIVWTFLYDKNVGLMNQFLAWISGGGIGPVNWLGDPKVAMWSIIIMSVWQGVGMHMVLFLAGLQGISDSLYEAAGIDGANAWQKFTNITIPGLYNIMVFIMITITIAAFHLFTQVFVMTNGGPNDATTTLTFHMVRKGFREQDIAYASTISVVFFIMVLVIAMVQRYLTRSQEA